MKSSKKARSTAARLLSVQAVYQAIQLKVPPVSLMEEYLQHRAGMTIDDVEMVLQAMLGCPIDTITFDSPNVISTEDRYAEEIAELKKELAACYREKDEDQVAIETLKDKCVDLVAEKIVEALRRREEELDKEDSNQD